MEWMEDPMGESPHFAVANRMHFEPHNRRTSSKKTTNTYTCGTASSHLPWIANLVARPIQSCQ